MKKRYVIHAVFAALVGLMLTACNSGTSVTEDSIYKSNASSLHDLSVSEMTFVSPESSTSGDSYTCVDDTNCSGYSGHAVHINYVIHSASEEAGETSVHFYVGLATHEGDLDEGDTHHEENAEEYILGSALLTDLPQGESSHSLLLNIPSELVSGQYRIYAFVDPMNVIEEYDETNNHPPSDPTADHIALDLNVSDARASTVDIQLESITLSQTNILLEADDNSSDHSSHDLEANINILHFSPDAHTPVDINASILVDGNWESLEIWNNRTHRYATTNHVSVANTTPSYHANVHLNIPTSVHDDINTSIGEAGEGNFTIRISISSETEDTNLTSNNAIEKQITINNGESESSMVPRFVSSDINKGLSSGFSKSVGDRSYFLGSLSLLAEAGVDTNLNRVSAKATSEVDVSVFGISKSLFYSIAEMYFAPNDSSLGRIASIEFIGQTLYDNSYEVSDPSILLKKEFAKEQLLAKASFVVGPVPITVTASAQGALGAQLELSWVDGEFKADGQPYAKLTAIGTGGVDIGLASAGVEADLTLVDDEFHVIPTITPVLSVENGITDVSGSFLVRNDLNLIDGNLGLFAKVKGVKTCKKCVKIFHHKHCVHYPCGFNETTYNKTLFDIHGFEQSQVLYDKTVDALLP